MLHSIKIKNFQSFLEEAHISMKMSQHVPIDDRSFSTIHENRLSKAMAIIGPNASGKTALIKSIAFLDWFIKHSFQSRVDAPIPLVAHFLAKGEPSHFEVEFEMDEKEWRYSLDADEHRVYSESLYCKQSRAFSYVFTRDWDEEDKKYNIKQKQFGLLQKEAEKVRENASLIATAAQYEVPLALQIVSGFVSSNVNILGRQYLDDIQIISASAMYAGNEDIRTQMNQLLCDWDLGLSSIKIEKQIHTQESGKEEDIFVPIGMHKINGVEHALIFKHESSGTQGAYLLLSRILPVLNNGGLAIIDELEADLHPHMLHPILNLFFSKKTNPKNAQIIFTCHSVEVLSLLHKSQVVLVEKNSECVSDAWRLDSVKGVRADDNLYAKYMAGAYGAIPRV
ncbi:AAA family ATPase [Polynucleobacter antarcticus]|uniref:Abortive infection protein n=1 Tax=Polynucleobacter antarcticus TaxID=1743162 RepID=A0A6M9PT58_9BURK|nr:ATP-binding protein [Polynucleobacter antarcticus]QKM62658.1 abortive infection protein [Polynucleobacter antarcticus]